MEAAAKQQVVERIKQAQNILVTVSTNPSVDQLAACIGLTLLLNKMGKHATAVFSGKIPPVLEFLQPNKTIEHNTDSLRDFIISLDKEKADKLRYKVEDQVVKIFITPYHTSLTENDLVFSQGDFNVEVVMALGVKDKTQVDAAITAHGRILHDSTVISINSGNTKAADIGQINWQEPTSSSLSEMLVSISEAFGTGLIDAQMATAFLTGIVSETKRFSNNKTSPKVMTMSAQLMAAGANQMLIVSKLEPPVPVVAPMTAAGPKNTFQGRPEGTLSVNHDKTAGAPQDSDVVSAEIHIDKEGNIIRPGAPAAGAEPSPQPVAPPATEVGAPLPEPEPAPAAEAPPDETESATPAEPPAAETPPTDTPAESAENESAKSGNETEVGGHRLLDPTTTSPTMGAAFTANTQTDAGGDGDTPLDPFAEPDSEPAPDGFLSHSVASVKPPSESGESAEPPHIESARNAVDSAFAAAPFDPALSPVQALNATPLGEEIHPPENQNQNDLAPPAPPPVPPPLMPTPGVVIPTTPYIPPANNDKQNG